MAATRASGTTARALRHHARERAQHHRRDGRRLGGQDGAARAQVGGRLRPDAADGGLGRHARHHHRADRAPVRHPRADPVRRLSVPHAGGRLQRRDPVDPARPRRGAHGDDGRRRRSTPSTTTPSSAWRRSRRCSWSSTAPRLGAATRSRTSRRDRREPRARSASTGPRRRRTAAGCGRRATSSTGPSRSTWPGKDALRHRRVRADLAARRMRGGDAGGHQVARA